MKFHLALFCLAVFVLTTPRPASACECLGVHGPFLRPGDQGIVATGRVVNVHFGNSTRNRAADVEILEGFLNARSGTRITVFNDVGNCSYPLRAGETYLLATFPETSDSPGGIVSTGNQVVSICGRTQVLNSPDGKKMLAAIRLEMRRLRR